MKIWKRNAVVGTIVLFVCVALYLSWQYGRTPEDDLAALDPIIALSPGDGTDGISDGLGVGDVDGKDGESVSDYFDEARLTRKKARDTALAILTDATARTETSQEVRDNAAREIEKMAQNAMLEATIENLIMAKGFSECVVFINQEGVSIVVSEPDGGMTSADAAKIKDIVLTESSLTAGDIHLVPVPV